MASRGGDTDRSEQIMKDIEMENDETFAYNVDVQNRYETGRGWGTVGFDVVDRGSKRKRVNTGSTGSAPGVSADAFQGLGTDGKLTVFFDMLCNMQSTQNKTSFEIKSINWNVASTREKADNVEKRVDIHERKLRMLSYKSFDLEARSRRNNLIFWGITERGNRQCDTLILSFMADEMRIDCAGMVIDRAHRLGPIRRPDNWGRSDQRRPIIVRFRDYRDVDHILDNAYKLRGSRFRADRDFPKEIVDARSRLNQCKEAQDARKKRSKMQVRYPAKLYINNRLVRDEFPDWFDLMKESRVEGFDVIDGDPDTCNNTCNNSTHDRQAHISPQQQPDSYYRNAQAVDSLLHVEKSVNPTSYNISFSVESVLLPKSNTPAPNETRLPPETTNVHENVNRTVYEQQSLPVKSSLNSSENTSSKTVSDIQESKESTCVLKNTYNTQNINPSQNTVSNTTPCTLTLNDLYTLYRPKSIERGGSCASSADSWQLVSTEDTKRRGRAEICW